MSKFILIIGGARSGKSSYAVKLARGLSHKVAYLATCANPDEEMQQRIKRHKNSRPRHWRVIEEARAIPCAFNKLKNKYEIVIIDCLGLLVANLLTENLADGRILQKVKTLSRCISAAKSLTILVSNEVGGGIVPDSPLARRFRDLLGLTNQMMAKEADEVILMQAGIPIKIKNAKCKMKNFKEEENNG